MSGVEILSQTNIYELDAYPWLIAVFTGIGLLASLIAMIIEWVQVGFDFDDLFLIFGCTFAGFLLGVAVFLLSLHKTDTIDYVEYKVTIDDSVSMNEFLDKYEIIDQEGRIYTVREYSND